MSDDGQTPGSGVRLWLRDTIARVALGRSTRLDPAQTLQGTDTLALEEEAAPDLLDPAQRELGDYELLELIGRGGMGLVYRAWQRSLQREVAVKLLTSGTWASPDRLEALRGEARHAARLQHPGIVTIYEMGEADGRLYFAMEYVAGSNLADRLAAGPLPPRIAAALLRGLAEAVDYAHRLGVLHLDLKPGNILIAADGTTKVADFGLARALGTEGGADNDRPAGTPAYMAPEQAEPGALGRATDVWGLGGVLYESLCGRPPFDNAPARTRIQQARRDPTPPPGRIHEGVPVDLDAICLHCLERDPARRYPTARALADDLGRFLEGRAVSVRPLGIAQRSLRWARREPRLATMAGVAVLALVIGLLATLTQWRRAERNATAAREQTWATRGDAAWRLVDEGHPFDALPLVFANLREREAQGDARGVALERRRLASLQRDNVQMIDAIATGAPAFAVAIDHDGERVAVSASEGGVRLYDVADGSELWRVGTRDATHFWDPGPVRRLDFTRDGQRLIADRGEPEAVTHPAGHDNILIDASTGRILLPPASRFPDFRDATYSADGRYAVLRNTQYQAQLFKVDGWEPLTPRRRFGNANGMWRVGDGARFIAWTQQTRLSLWDPRTLATRWSHEFGTVLHRPSAWAVQPGGDLLAMAHKTGTVRLLDTQLLTLRELRPAPNEEVKWIAFSPDGRWLAAIAAGRSFVWEVATGHGGALPRSRMSSRSTQIQVDAQSGTVLAFSPPEAELWNLPDSGQSAIAFEQRVSAAQLQVPQFPLARGMGEHAMAYAPSAHLAASVDWSGEVRLWRWQEPRQLRARTTSLSPAELFYDGRHVPVVEGRTARVVDLEGERPVSRAFEHPQPVSLATLAADGRTLVTVSGRRVSVIDWRVGRSRFAPKVLDDSPLRIATSPDSRVLLVTTGDYRDGGFRELASTFDLHTGRAYARDVPLPGPLGGLRFRRDGRQLVHWRYGQAQMRDAATLQPVGRTFRFGPDMAEMLRKTYGGTWNPNAVDARQRETRPVLDAMPSADGARLTLLVDASMSTYPLLLQWDVGSNRLLRTRVLSNAYPLRLLPHGDDFEVVLWGQTRTHWTDARGRMRSLPQAPDDLRMAQSISHDGRWLATSSRQGVMISDTESGQWAGMPLVTRLPLEDALAQLAFSPDGRRLLGRSHHGRWLWWSLDPDPRAIPELQRSLAHLRPPEVADGTPLTASLSAQARSALRAQDPGRPPAPRAPIASDTVPPATTVVPATGFSHVDLGPAINHAVGDTHVIFGDPIGLFASVPMGGQRYRGVDFDIRGIVALQMAQGPSIEPRLPMRSVPVSPPQPRFDALHVLLSGCCMLQGRPQAPYGVIVLRYADGSRARLPILYHRDVWEPWTDPGDAIPARIAWVETAPRAYIQSGEMPYRIYMARFANPHPDRDVASIGFEATDLAWSGPLILAATVEQRAAGVTPRPEAPPAGASVCAAALPPASRRCAPADAACRLDPRPAR